MITEKEKEIEETLRDLDEAQARQELQYAAMKKRIQFILLPDQTADISLLLLYRLSCLIQKLFFHLQLLFRRGEVPQRAGYGGVLGNAYSGGV